MNGLLWLLSHHCHVQNVPNDLYDCPGLTLGEVGGRNLLWTNEKTLLCVSYCLDLLIIIISAYSN